MNTRQSTDVSLEILWTQFESITREMEAMLVRTAFSSGIRDAGDCSCALFDAAGRMVSQASTAPGQMGSMPFLMAEFQRRVPAGDISDGDVFITNDPWLGCGHTPDIYVVTPIFNRGELVGYAANSGHHADLGGRLGSQESREVYEEGLLVPLSHLHTRGVENRELVALLRLNSRLPDELIGDLRAQMAANHVARQRLIKLAEVHRLASGDIVAAADEIIRRSGEAMREALAGVMPGIHRGEMLLDDFDDAGKRLEIRLALRAEGGQIVVDFAGTSAQVAKPINSVLNYSRAYVFIGLKMAVAPALPTNAGSIACLQMVAPEGSLVNPLFPAPVRWRTTVGLMLADLVLTVLAGAMPDKVIAGSGTVPRWHQVFSSRGSGRNFMLQPHFMGGMGGASAHDGLSAIAWPANLRELSIEALEQDGPLLFLRKAFRDDSGGAGTFRGGLGEEVVVRNPKVWGNAPAQPVRATLNCGRFHEGAIGIAGGAPGARGELIVNGKRVDRSRSEVVLQPGDEILFQTPGGGGFGPPAERDRRLVADDLDKGFISPESARSIYGFDGDLEQGKPSLKGR